jgi:hypothetical protein
MIKNVHLQVKCGNSLLNSTFAANKLVLASENAHYKMVFLTWRLFWPLFSTSGRSFFSNQCFYEFQVENVGENGEIKHPKEL